MLTHSRNGFTLIEILVIIGIIAVLIAILFPVMSSTRKDAQQSVCLSNLRQIGQGVSLYLQDYDAVYPRALNPLSKLNPANDAWLPAELEGEAKNIPVFQDVLYPYTKEKHLFQCPLDLGFDNAGDDGLEIKPDVFSVLGSSYFFMELFYGESESCFQHPAEYAYIRDLNPNWHSRSGSKAGFEQGRINTLYYDYHVKSILYTAIKDGHSCEK